MYSADPIFLLFVFVMEGNKPIKTHLDTTTNEPEAGTEGNKRKESKINGEEMKLLVGNIVIVADKSRLVESSPYFASLLRFHANADSNAVSLEPPENVHLGTFLAMLHSIISAEVKLNISATNVWDCIVLSIYLQLEHVEKKCYKALRKMLGTLTLDELLRLWRNGHTCAIQQITTLVMVSISLKMDGASQSTEFLDFAADELVALMSDDGFLPLVESDVCEAVVAWLEHDSNNRKQPLIMERVLAELVRDESSKTLIQTFAGEYPMPERMPKRMINSYTRDTSCQAGQDSIIVGNYIYNLKDARDFHRNDTFNGERQQLAGLSTGYGSRPEDPYGLCLVKVSDGDKIGCFASYWQRTRMLTDDDEEHDTFAELENSIALYDIVNDVWEYLPPLPFPRIATVMIQCGTFVYVIGGAEQKYYWETGLFCAHHCYRLDLVKFTASDHNWPWVGAWERIADLNAPRVEHFARVQYGRIIVYGGRTETRVNDEGRKRYEEARWSEAYDTTLKIWTVFQPSS